MSALFVAVVALLSTVDAAPAVTQLPFKRIVAFGDNLSDNGNGSYAHCVAQPNQCQNKIYGYKTWTNGPVAVSYLSGSLKIPVLDYAFGHANGGSLYGAVIDPSYTPPSTNAIPSSKQQIANYTANTRGSVADSLHFLWIGANDINLHHIFTWQPVNQDFGNSFSALLRGQIQTLLNKGARHIFVPNLYPKHLTNSAQFYASDAAGKKSLKDAIVYANSRIKAMVLSMQQQHPKAKIIYHDAFSVIQNAFINRQKLHFTHVSPDCCDGCGQTNFDLCIMQGQGAQFMWVQSLDPTTRVHQMLAADMYKTLLAHY